MPDAYDDAIALARALPAPLDVRLGVIRDACRAFEPAYDAAVDRFASRLAAGAAGALGAGEGDLMPDFALPDQDGVIWRLGDFLARGPLVLLVLRGVWCEFCDLALRATAEAAPALRATGAQVAALAPQRAYWGLRHRASASAPFPMLADVGSAYAVSLGLAAVLDDELRGCLAGFGVDLAEVNGDEGRVLPMPATYVVGPDGRIALRRVDADPRRRADPSLALEAVVAGARQQARG